MEETPNQASHEQKRYEDRHERQAHRDNGESDLACANLGGLQRSVACLQLADDVFNDHNRVIHYEAHRDR